MLMKLLHAVRRLPYGGMRDLAKKTGLRYDELTRMRHLAALVESRDERLVRLIRELGLRPEDVFGAQ